MDEFQELWMKLIGGEIPKPLFLIGFIASNLVTAWASRSASKDKNKSEILTEAMKRQSELDNHQRQIVEEFKTEVKRLKGETGEIKEEIKRKKEDNDELFSKNQELLSKIGQLQLENERKDYELEKLREKCEEDTK